MSDCYVLKPDPSKKPQSQNDYSFLGGLPRLPSGQGIPRCTLCGSEQSFFFQVAFPEGSWRGLSLAVFACTACVDKEHFIPQMLPGPLAGACIPERFLESYQTNFGFLVFETATATPCGKYQERVTFKRLRLARADDPTVDENKIGGIPNWLLEDESPKSYAGKTPMLFLLQLLPDFPFVISESAPRQIELGLDRRPRPSTHSHYELFIGNKIFLFGTEDRARPLVYAITQVD